MKKSLQFQQMAQQARWISELLTRDEPGTCSNKNESCIVIEERRQLTRVERGKGWARRPFSAYDPEKMCNACRAYWFASMTANALNDLHVSALRIEASQERSAQEATAS